MFFTSITRKKQKIHKLVHGKATAFTTSLTLNEGHKGIWATDVTHMHPQTFRGCLY